MFVTPVSSFNLSETSLSLNSMFFMPSAIVFIIEDGVNVKNITTDKIIAVIFIFHIIYLLFPNPFLYRKKSQTVAIRY